MIKVMMIMMNGDDHNHQKSQVPQSFTLARWLCGCIIIIVIINIIINIIIIIVIIIIIITGTGELCVDTMALWMRLSFDPPKELLSLAAKTDL